jgi:hypothetical protein
MADQSRDNALSHVVVAVFENWSLDNVLSRLCRPGYGKTGLPDPGVRQP